jgi:UDP-N-acetylmuramate--alanine ligase
MHVFFSGIGGTGIGPLALLARQAGYEVSGSDAKDSSYIDYLRKHDINNIHIGQGRDQIEDVDSRKPIDWFVYSSALPKTDPHHPELQYCLDNNIRMSKRNEFLNEILQQKSLKLVAIAGTHGKTTTTAMAIWAFGQLGLPVSYNVGAKLSFGDMGHYDSKSEYFVYECDEYDHNFLSFSPYLAMITGIDWDHPDIYPTRDLYYDAFRKFLGKSRHSMLWLADAAKLGEDPRGNNVIIDEKDEAIGQITLPGEVNRQDAFLVAKSLAELLGRPLEELVNHLNAFPGISRRFEELKPGLYTDYAHTPPKIAGALQLAHEVAGRMA